MNTIVPFETAKLLKKKGFNKETLNFYSVPKSKMFGIDEKGRAYPIKNTFKKLYTCNKHASLKKENVYFAPTIGQVVMWLYEEHKLWIVVIPTITGFFTYKVVDVQDNPEQPIERPPYDNVCEWDYYSPTETYLASIEYILNELI